MQRQHGATLIELVVSIVIISVTLSSVMMLIVRTSASSADPLLRTQAIAIAESYMEEILTQPLTDPSGGDTGGPETGEVRATFDDVTDYPGLSDTGGAADQTGSAIAGLEGYNVAVNVTSTALNGAPARRIEVVVTYDGEAGFAFPLAAYRMN